MVVQEYINDPYLIDGLKFDLRIYVLITSCDPLTVYVYKEGLARFATQQYAPILATTPKNAMKNMFVHLTNYSLNKTNSNYITPTASNDTNAHKRTISSVFNNLKQQGIDTDSIWEQI